MKWIKPFAHKVYYKIVGRVEYTNQYYHQAYEAAITTWINTTAVTQFDFTGTWKN